MDDLEGEVIGEKVHECGFENRFGPRPQRFESILSRRRKNNRADARLFF
jgi:hypothetical protein